MAITKLLIWNTALANLNEHALADTTTANKLQESLDRFWRTAYESCLQAATWNFATKYATLTATSETPDDWGYEYELPSDFLRAIEIPMVCGMRSTFCIRTRAGTRYLYCNVQDADLRYIFDPGNDDDDDFLLWNYPFMEYVAAKLSSLIAISVTGKPAEQQRCINLTRMKLDEALGLDLANHRSEQSFSGRYSAGRA